MRKFVKALAIAAIGIGSYAAGKIVGTGQTIAEYAKNPSKFEKDVRESVSATKDIFGERAWKHATVENPWLEEYASQDEETKEESPITVTTNAEPETEEADNQPED